MPHSARSDVAVYQSERLEIIRLTLEAENVVVREESGRLADGFDAEANLPVRKRGGEREKNAARRGRGAGKPAPNTTRRLCFL